MRDLWKWIAILALIAQSFFLQRQVNQLYDVQGETIKLMSKISSDQLDINQELFEAVRRQARNN